MMAEGSAQLTILTLSVFSVERYFAICHPFFASKHKLSSRTRAMKIIVAIWLVGFLAAIPTGFQFTLVYHVDDHSETVCTIVNKMGLYFVELKSICFTIIPVLLICVMYVLIALALRKPNQMINSSSSKPTDGSKQRTPKLLSE